MRSKLLMWSMLAVPAAWSQTTPVQIRNILAAPLDTPGVVAHQLRQYLVGKAPRLAVASDPAAWARQAGQLRRRLLDEVVFHGWPRAWVDAPPRFEPAGAPIEFDDYRIRKFRYEVVPGMWSGAALYEPSKLAGKVPAILNVNGHVGEPGKAVEYKQKRLITQARHGILALNLEWLGMGELTHPDSRHWFGAHLDLVGANEIGLFYLAMRRGLDFLEQHPAADRTRLGVTGLSGGGWQTIILSSLDERVNVSVPVAGYSAFVSRVERPADTGDIEQNATDLLTIADYPQLTAMRAPRPTLLIYNAEDDCCFRAPLVKPYVFDEVQPVYRLYGAVDKLAWHENTDPSDHNYQLDNRLAGYAFFARHFGLPPLDRERVRGEEILTRAQLDVGLPAGNLTILGLARRMAESLERGAGSRERLASVVRYRPVAIERVWAIDNSKNRGLETRSYRFVFAGGLSATGVWLHAIAAEAGAAATILLNDKGKAESAAAVSERVNRGEQALAADLVFTGDAAPQKPGPESYAQMIATAGERPLGIEAAQLIALARWMRSERGAPKVRVETSGMRSQVAALVAAALAPDVIAAVEVREGIPALRRLLDAPVEYQAAPDLFCLDLLKEFDIPQLAALAGASKVTGAGR